ncbi:MAG: hypothetical protein AB7S48_10775 [Bacteroidales bacterium]
MLNIGITYDLRSDYLKLGFSEEETAEFDSEVTISAIEQTLQQLGYRTHRIGNVYSLIECLGRGEKWDLVFNICEGLYGIGREAQVPAILDAYKIPYVFSDALVLALTLHKGQTKRIVRDHGIPTADFAVVESLSDISQIDLPYPLFAKPVAEGTGKGIDGKSKISTPQDLVPICENLLYKFNQPVLVETYLPGREFTVGIVGSGDQARAVGVMEIIITHKAKEQTYSLHTKENWVGIVDYKLATGDVEQICAETALSAWRSLGCRDGGRVDLKMDAFGIPNFIEVNPLAGINPEHSDFPMLARFKGIDYNSLIGMIMNSALDRIYNNVGYNGKKVEIGYSL